MRPLERRALIPHGNLARSRSQLAALALASLYCGLISGCAKPVERAECDQMLDRYVEFLMHNQDPEVPFEEVRRKQRDARAKAEASPEFASCTDKVSRKQYECAMQAPNADRLEQCLVF